MGMIGMDELGPLGIRPTGLGLTPIEQLQRIAAGQARLQQIAAGQARRPATRHPRTKRVGSSPSITDRVGPSSPGGPGRRDPRQMHQTGGGSPLVVSRAFGRRDTRTTPQDNTSSVGGKNPGDFEYITESEFQRRGGSSTYSPSEFRPGFTRFNPNTKRYEKVVRITSTSGTVSGPGQWRAPEPARTYQPRGGFFQALLDALTAPRTVSAPGVSFPRVPSSPIHQRRLAELARRQQQLEQARVNAERAKAQASRAHAERLAREQAARQDRIRRDRVWREAMRSGWEEDIIQSVLNGSMSYDQANLEQARRDRQSSQNATGQPYVALPGVPSPPIHVPRRPAVVVKPRPEAGTSVIHQRGTLGPISVGPAQPASAPPGSWQWHQQRTDLEAIKAAAIARSPQARQAYQGQATGAGPTFWLAR